MGNDVYTWQARKQADLIGVYRMHHGVWRGMVGGEGRCELVWGGQGRGPAVYFFLTGDRECVGLQEYHYLHG